jgi:hypothetical protein
MNIDQLYRFVNFVSNKEQRGNITPDNFNLLVKTSQIEFISKRIGNVEILSRNIIGRGGNAQTDVTPYGYKSHRRIDEDLRPLVYGPIEIPIGNPSGLFSYPYGYIWPDSLQKNDFRVIRIIDSDQYPFVKHSVISPPTEKFPICIFRGSYGFIDPYSIGSFQMSYLKYPPDPFWNYISVNDEPQYNPSGSVNLSIPEHTHMDVAMLILQHVGINLDSAQITEYSMTQEQRGT